MCGIFGYVGNEDATVILLEGLQKLEYRGYDSAGIAIKNSKNTVCYKQVGKISNLKKSLEDETPKGTTGIAHTRWATHGEPTKINAHPHQSCDNKLFLVHNGIIENADALRVYLEKKGHKIKSETDTEVLVHLIEDLLHEKSLGKAVREALKLIKGTYGVVVMHSDFEELICARNGSPLIIGKTPDSFVVASDIPAIANRTSTYYVLKDNEIAVLNKNKFKIFNKQNQKSTPDLEKITWDIESIEKGDYDHFMIKEIFEQPDSLRNCMRGRLKEDKIVFSLPQELDVQNTKSITILGCGTSWHAGLVAKYFMESLLKIPVNVAYASEFRYSPINLTKNDLVIAISQSGETADTLAAVKKSKEYCKTLGIVNVVGSTIARTVDSGVYIHAGPEIGVASTKAFTGQITALMLVALHMGQELGTINRAQFKELHDELIQIPEKIEQSLSKENIDIITKVAETYYNSTNALYLGRGINFPTALEGALKLKEISYIHAEGYPAAEMKHGPIALIDENMPVFFITGLNNTYEKILSNMQEVKARKGKIITIANKQDSVLEKLSDYVIYTPETHDLLSPLLNVIPLQLIAYKIALLKGLDPDKPRNLAKSVTVE